MRPSRLAVSWGPLFFDAAGLEFCKPSAEFGQFGRREPQDRFLDIFDRHGGRNSTPASELEEPLAGKPGCKLSFGGRDLRLLQRSSRHGLCSTARGASKLPAAAMATTPPSRLAATSLGGLNFFRSIVTFSRGSRPEFALRRPLEFRTVPWEGISMSGENSCFSRFLVKFVEVSAAGLATAISAYALAHLGGLLSSSPTPPSPPATAVQLSPIASEPVEGLRAKPTPPDAAAAVNKQSPAPQQGTDGTIAQPARKAAKDAKALPPRKHTKTETSVAEKEPRGQTSAEALARAALANVDANRPAPSEAPIEPGLADTRFC